MSAYREIMAELRDLTEWKLRLFGAGCAHRLRPLVDACGSGQTAALYQRGLEAAWTAAESGERSELVAGLEAAPENAAESSAERAYYVRVPIAVLATVLRPAQNGGTSDIGKLACSQGLHMHADVDYTLLPKTERPRIIDPRTPPSPGPLEEAEALEERAAIALLRDVTSPGQAVDALRARADRHARELAAAMPAFLANGEWVD